MKRRLIIHREKILIFLTVFLLSNAIVLCNGTYIDYSLKTKLRIAAVIVSCLTCFKYSEASQYIRKQTLLFAAVLIALVGIMIGFSRMQIGLVLDLDPTKAVLIDAGCIACAFGVMYKAGKYGFLDFSLKVIELFLLLAITINDIIVFFFPTIPELLGGAWWKTYFLGTKFDVVYTHLMAISFIYMLHLRQCRSKKIKNIGMIVSVLYSMVVTIEVDCNTGIISTILVFLLIYIIEKKITFFTKPIVYLTVLFLGVGFLLVYETILQSDLVRFIVQDIFKREPTLTGRTNIYAKIAVAMTGNWLTGYGYGINYDLTRELMQADNTQNGLAEWVFQIGIIGTAALIVLLWICFHRINKARISRKSSAILAVLYTLTIIASIEVSIDLPYFLLVAVLYGFAIESEYKYTAKIILLEEGDLSENRKD